MNYLPSHFALRGKAGGKSNKKNDSDVIAPTYSKSRLFRPAFLGSSAFSLPHRSASFNQPSYCVRPKLNQRLIGKQNFFRIVGKAILPQSNSVIYGLPDELSAVLLIAKRFIQTLHGRSIQPQCGCNRQSFRPCHLIRIRQPFVSHQTATYYKIRRHLLLTFSVALIRMQLMIVAFRSRPHFARES